MNSYFKHSVCLIALILMTSNVHARRFTNSYISFELPDGWNCRNFGVSWICNHANPTSKKEAQIVFAAKEAGANDNEKAYMEYLKKPRQIEAFKKGTFVTSKHIHSRTKLIGNLSWVDGLHSSSEFDNYYTRYLATTHKDLAILASFTMQSNAYPYYSEDILRAIESLTVVFNKPIVGQAGSGNSTGGGVGKLGGGGMSQFGELNIDGEELNSEGASKKGIDAQTTFAFLILLLALVGYIYLKMKKGTKKKKVKR